MFWASPQSDSFEELAMPLLHQLYNLAHWLTQNREEAEDLVQETYVQALKRFSLFSPGPIFGFGCIASCETHSDFVAQDCATSTVPPDAEADGPELAVEHDNPEAILMRLTDSKALQSAIDGLPVHHREILLLCEVEETSYQEIAESLSIPIGTLMSRLSRARKTLQDVLRLQFQKG